MVQVEETLDAVYRLFRQEIIRLLNCFNNLTSFRTANNLKLQWVDETSGMLFIINLDTDSAESKGKKS